jgi:Glycosyl hydrolase family 26
MLSIRRPTPAVRRRTGILLCGTLLAAIGTSAPAFADSKSFDPVADAQVTSAYPSTSYGAARTLKVDASPATRSYLRFNVQLPAGATISDARLRLYTTTTSAKIGYSANAVQDTAWSETALTYGNAPALGSTLGTSAPWTSAGWKSAALPVSSVRPGLNSVAVTTASTAAAVFSSREGTYKPRLVLTYTAPTSTATAPAPAPAPSSPLQPPAHGPALPAGAYWGAFVNPDGINAMTRAEESDLESKIGRKLGISSHYRDWTDLSFPYSYANGADEGWDVANGRIPMISQGDSGFTGTNILDAINNGSQDAIIRAHADHIKAFGKPLFYRLFWEMNGDWEPYNEAHTSTPGTHDGTDKYVRAWRRIHDIFQQEGATNAAFVWCPNASDGPKTAENHWTRYYPGDAYVDWVCADGYNRGTARSWSSWETFESDFAAIYADYPQKPFMVGETSSVEQGGDKAQWIRDTANTLKTKMTRIKAFVWFSRGPGAQSPEDWRADSSASSLAAYAAMGADPYFKQ